MALRNVEEAGGALENFDSLLHESDSEVDPDEGTEYICFDVEDKEDNIGGVDPLKEEFKIEEPHPNIAALPEDCENHGSPSVIPRMFNEMGQENPLKACPSPAQFSPILAFERPPYNIIVKIEANAVLGGDDDITMEENVFHLADEHEVFIRMAQKPQRSQCWRGRGHPRTLGQGRLPREETGTQRVLIELNVNDDDVPDELREMVMRVVAAREEAKDWDWGTTRVRHQRTEVEEEEWMDADDGDDEALFGGIANAACFEWSSMDDYQGEREEFLPQETGPVVKSKNAYEAFRQYWDDGILTHIVTETNRHAARLYGSSGAFPRDWYDTNIHELLILFSFWMMLGVIRMPTIKSCFAQNPLLQTNIFRKMFTRSRYENLCRALHFNDNNRPSEDSNHLFCFGPILSRLNSRFMEAYIPSQNLCIDESLTLWKGKLCFNQYIKPARFEVKTIELSESSTGYLWAFFLNLGDSTAYDPTFPSKLLKRTSSVLTLVRPLLDKGYTLFMDYKFNNPLLARFLKSRKTDCVGTLRSNCRSVPPILSLCELKEGQFVSRHSGDVVVLAYQDQKRKVTCISTYHGNLQDRIELKPHHPSRYKPSLILDYNMVMGGVDRKDQTLEPYLLERRRCRKWYIKVFKRLLHYSMLNSRIHLAVSTASPKEPLVFQLELVDQILQNHLQHTPKPIPERPVSSSHISGTEEKHWPRQIDAFVNSGRRARRSCVYCMQHCKTRRRTTFLCSVCDVPLCVKSCFKLYHNNS